MLEAVTEGVEGIVVPQHDAASLADAIERLADDKELRVRLGRAAAARFDREFD
jgi:glycosyltransferase involved in cell wall biosynthesis